MDHIEIQTRFLEFFFQCDHRQVPGSSLVPLPGDPVLLTTSGMHPLTEFLLGRPHPLGPRLTSVQRCVRTTDLEEVGDETHLTLFTMLGSWSLGGPEHGGYDGLDSLRWGVELLEQLGLERTRMHGTVYGGSQGRGPDLRGERLLKGLGLPVERLESNWWSNGPTGPCGPDSELFLWHDPGDPGSVPSGTPSTDRRWVEVWNHVNMLFMRHGDGSLTELEQPNVDTGLGLERLVMLLEGVGSVHESTMMLELSELLPWSLPTGEQRVLLDHLRTVVVLLGDGVRFSSSGRGYVLRRLTRRLLSTLWRHHPTGSTRELPELFERRLGQQLGMDLTGLRSLLTEEEQRFCSLLTHSRELLRRELRRGGGVVDPERLEWLRSTHGVPLELSRELLE